MGVSDVRTETDIRMLICGSEQSIIEGLKRIDANAKGMIFVVDNEERFLGAVTDGDIRRSIIAGGPLDASIGDLLRGKESISMPVNTPVVELLSLVNQSIKIIPLLDDNGRVTDYFEFQAKFHAAIASTHLDGNELNYVLRCLSTNWISSQGSFVTQFENDFAQFLGMKHAASAMNGTAALHLALLALGIGPGDEVIVPDLTFAATINAVLYTGATPVIVDVQEASWCVDPDAIKNNISSKTRAIIPVHLYGQPCDMPQIMDIADRHGLYVVEDCAQAHGAEISGRRVGSFGHINCFSFFANKIITTGEGGVCVTDNEEWVERMRILRDHGMNKDRRYWHDVVGYNYRMTNLQAAIGVAQLEKIDVILRKRDQIRGWYENNLADCGEFEMQNIIPGTRSVTWLFSTLFHGKRVDRETFIARLKKSGVDARPFFFALSAMPVYRAHARDICHVSHGLSARGVNLPTLMGLDEEAYVRIARTVKECIQ